MGDSKKGITPGSEEGKVVSTKKNQNKIVATLENKSIVLISRRSLRKKKEKGGGGEAACTTFRRIDLGDREGGLEITNDILSEKCKSLIKGGDRTEIEKKAGNSQHEEYREKGGLIEENHPTGSPKNQQGTKEGKVLAEITH